jgi:serine/threonine protein phosphatase PrpC
MWRLHWIAADLWPVYQAGVEARCRTQCPALAPCRVVEDEGGRWVIASASGQPAHPWLKPAADHVFGELRRLADHLDQVSSTLDALRQAGYQWLTFDPRELEYGPLDGCLQVTNLDVQLFPIGHCPAEVQFNARFAAPEICRFDGAQLGPGADVFHVAMLGYYWLARLLPGGFVGRGLEAFSHQVPPLRIFHPLLPGGIAPVLSRGLACQPRDRFTSPADLCAALRRAIDAAVERDGSRLPVSWEIGAHTRTGRAKEALGRANEDAVLCRTWASPDRSLVAVADGITTCDVGTGALASLLTCLALDNTFDATVRSGHFEERMNQACQRAAENLLQWALEKGKHKPLRDGAVLMGTTLTAVWLEDNQAQVANIGDSRVYLLTQGCCEQLTVDGDLGTSLLASGAPPEDVLELGRTALALRECVGGCDCTPDGRLAIVQHHNRPAFSRWNVRPGDVLVLCSDGLVEEGRYLAPVELEPLICEHGHLSAEELAVQLVYAADARQRPPSPLEPEGHGDNITCVVIKIGAPPS